MGREQSMWSAIRPAMKEAGLDPERIENQVGSGTPDVNIKSGWVELKAAERWPPRGGPLRLPHYMPQQKAWAIRRIHCGGCVWLLLKVGKADWLLFWGVDAARVLGKVPRAELEDTALQVWAKKPTAEELRELLE